MNEIRKILVSGASEFWGGVSCPFDQDTYFQCFNDEVYFVEGKPKSAPEYRYYKLRESNKGFVAGNYIVKDLNQNVLKCIKCGDTEVEYEPCSNCGHKVNYYCTYCQRPHHQGNWHCKKCHCNNSLSTSLFHQVEIESPIIDKRCFIASACYREDAEEVSILRNYRDNVLQISYTGRVFVKLYYYISPPIAKIIEKSPILKSLVRKKILTPFIRIIQHYK